MATMASLRRALLLILTYSAFFVDHVIGNFTLHSPMRKDVDIHCIDECHFFAENQTLVIINITNPKQAVKGVGYYTTPVRMKDPATRTVASFNTTFTFRQEPEFYNASATTPEQISKFLRGDGFTFMMSSSSNWSRDVAGRFGIFATSPLVDPKVVAIEYDSWSSDDTDYSLRQEEHVGLDVGSANSEKSCFSYINSTLGLVFWHRDVLHSWIEYDGRRKNLQVRVANTTSRPLMPLVNCTYDLYDAVDERMWIGFSGAHGDHWSVYYIYNWTFTSSGISPDFPSSSKSSVSVAAVVGICAGGGLLAIIAAVAVALCVYRRKKRAAQYEPWDNEGMVEMAGMPEFISYKHLSAATKQFSDQSKLGQGGFGSVYKGVLPRTGAHVAVKKVSSDSKQGEREFLAEVQIISQLRHRNIVELIGFCRDRGKFLLVYELMPRGSLDQALFLPEESALSWSQRWKIVSGTAAALHYLHQGWRQQVIHRDVKSSNIMMDADYNPKLGDFGLARLVDHEKNAATTLVAGTYGYIAPEATGGKFTDKTDVFAFGAVCLEVVCGRKAYDGNVANYDDLVLVELVWRRMNEGELLSVADPLLDQFDDEQVCTVLKLGLLCSHPDPSLRPSMRQVVQVLAGDADVPDVPEVVPKASGKPQFSIDDLLSSGTQSSKSGGKRSAQDTLQGSISRASSSSVPSSTSFGTITALHPR